MYVVTIRSSPHNSRLLPGDFHGTVEVRYNRLWANLNLKAGYTFYSFCDTLYHRRRVLVLS